ncbi:MAG: hypothetical protein DMF82_11655 [Acidobacteria bacterium]|nr:MAG: hypothetical protein DMF82_11655 [Acidobacteriota bacterium]
MSEHLMGKVVSATADIVRIQTADGTVRELHTDAQTRYERSGHPAGAGDLRPGTSVMVDAERMDDHWMARRVQIEGGEATQPSHTETPTAPGQGAYAMPTDTGSERNLFQSDMWLMAGMTPRDPMGDMAMPQWRWMTMGIVRLVYNRQGGPSGDDAFESTNWSMIMGQRDVGRGRLTLMAMNSAEPATLASGGSPQLFQTGETLHGRPLVDRQHPHDLFMNLSATYRVPLGSESAWWAQAALRGEPALGPTAYMHRASAGENPAAILGHHLQDSTHITDTVFTVGAGWHWLTVEASAFHGAEPDEDRWDIDPGAPDSVSARVKVSLPSGWSGQVSHGFLKHPEALVPGNLRRTTASVHYGESGDRPLAGSFVWGHNSEDHGSSDSFLLEGAWQLTPADHVYARAERVDKDLHLLEEKGLDQHPEPAGAEETTVAVRALTVGYLRDLVVLRDVKVLDQLHLGLGADLTVYGVPSEVKAVYGDSPVSVHVFLRARWGRPHGSGGHMGH